VAAAGSLFLDLRRFAQRAGTKGAAGQVVKKVVIDLGSSTTIKTPVGDPATWAPGTPVPAGYVGGRARGSWQYSKDNPNETEPGGVDKSGAATIGKLQAGVMSGNVASEHYFVSVVPYMRKLEYEGWSGQAPDGMLRLSIREFQSFVDGAIAELR
jgi:hypothetical protein